MLFAFTTLALLLLSATIVSFLDRFNIIYGSSLATVGIFYLLVILTCLNPLNLDSGLRDPDLIVFYYGILSLPISFLLFCLTPEKRREL